MTRCGASYTVKCYTEPEGLRSLVPYGHWVRGSRGSKTEESEVLRVPAAFAPSVLITNGSKTGEHQRSWARGPWGQRMAGPVTHSNVVRRPKQPGCLLHVYGTALLTRLMSGRSNLPAGGQRLLPAVPEGFGLGTSDALGSRALLAFRSQGDDARLLIEN
jgi:hypothetical protein